MKIIKLTAILCLGYFGYTQYQNSFSQSAPLAGNWQSNKHLSMNELYKIGLTNQQEAFFDSILGNMTYSISGHNWDVTHKGKTVSSTFKILSESNGCYHVELSSRDKKNVCIVEGNLHVDFTFSGLHSTEVFSRI